MNRDWLGSPIPALQRCVWDRSKQSPRSIPILTKPGSQEKTAMRSSWLPVFVIVDIVDFDHRDRGVIT
jgi:hypothetical protein